MSSKVGRQMLADIIGSGGATVKYYGFTWRHLETLHERATKRSEAGFSIEEVVNFVVAPVIYHILFEDRESDTDYCRALVMRLFPR